MPKLWNDTIETHRDAVRQALLDAAAEIVARHGIAGVTMSAIAQRAGIGRATLYKYFPDVESILLAWHERQIEAHLTELTRIRDRTEGVQQQLEAVLHAYAFLSGSGHDQGDAEAARLHQGRHVGPARKSLQVFLAGLIQAGSEADVFRADVAPEELAAFCLCALEASAGLTSPEAVQRLVQVTLDALNPRQH
ncbi:TetR/AcrR family transcriptional regulator [Arthrobacter sp. ISL-69]|uniref:TetR/AcrR family transcriptional regulator n=1 Tax=Arthrobacter sp. ISL-69 TaxID=2819113 RepID=UPI001BE545B5|nr:TetR/AcrR family transcriptional regulator [Arthrobacter sp. ISL-69]MBT2538456.1 TetR/AcrR family transcriptional regulator [Arthrobacter sp. ISL-69]